MKQEFRSCHGKAQRVKLMSILDVLSIILIFFFVAAYLTQETAVEVDRPNPVPIEKTASEVIPPTISQSNPAWLGDRIVDLPTIELNFMTLLYEVPDQEEVIGVDAAARHSRLIHAL